MKWTDVQHGLRTEPSGAITIAALLSRQIDLKGEGDLVVVVGGRNVAPDDFEQWTG
jgi:threonine dehydratase